MLNLSPFPGRVRSPTPPRPAADRGAVPGGEVERPAALRSPGQPGAASNNPGGAPAAKAVAVPKRVQKFRDFLSRARTARAEAKAARGAAPASPAAARRVQHQEGREEIPYRRNDSPARRLERSRTPERRDDRERPPQASPRRDQGRDGNNHQRQDSPRQGRDSGGNQRQDPPRNNQRQDPPRDPSPRGDRRQGGGDDRQQQNGNKGDVKGKGKKKGKGRGKQGK